MMWSVTHADAFALAWNGKISVKNGRGGGRVSDLSCRLTAASGFQVVVNVRSWWQWSGDGRGGTCVGIAD